MEVASASLVRNDDHRDLYRVFRKIHSQIDEISQLLDDAPGRYDIRERHAYSDSRLSVLSASLTLCATCPEIQPAQPQQKKHY